MSESHNAAEQNSLFAKSKNELLRLEQLHKTCTQFAESLLEQEKYQQQMQSANEQLTQQCKDVAEKQAKLSWEYDEALKKFEEINLNLEEQQILTEKLFYILGFKLTSLESIGFTEQVATLHYNAECYVKLKIGGVHTDLLEIQPMHPNFEAIKQKAQETNDLRGLLANLRKFFEIVVKLKDEN